MKHADVLQRYVTLENFTRRGRQAAAAGETIISTASLEKMEHDNSNRIWKTFFWLFVDGCWLILFFTISSLLSCVPMWMEYYFFAYISQMLDISKLFVSLYIHFYIFFAHANIVARSVYDQINRNNILMYYFVAKCMCT